MLDVGLGTEHDRLGTTRTATTLASLRGTRTWRRWSPRWNTTPDRSSHADEAAWRRDLARLDASIATLDDRHVIAGLVRLAAALGDAHTRVFVPRDVLYPVRLLGFEDGIFVAGANADAAWAVGKRVVAVDHKPIADAVAALTPLVSAENPAFLAGELPSLLENPVADAGMNVARDHRMTLTVADGDGDGQHDLELVAGRSVALAPPKLKPLHLDGPTELAYWNKYVADHRLLYLQYNACQDDDRVGPFAAFAASTLAFADVHPVDRFVIDLRSNQGGNSAILEPLIAGLAARPALAGRVFVLIGRTTLLIGGDRRERARDPRGRDARRHADRRQPERLRRDQGVPAAALAPGRAALDEAVRRPELSRQHDRARPPCPRHGRRLVLRTRPGDRPRWSRRRCPSPRGIIRDALTR